MSENLISRIDAVQAYGEQYLKSSSLKQKKQDLREFTPHFTEAQRSLSRTLKLYGNLANLGRNVTCDTDEIKDALAAVSRDLEKENFNPWNAEKLKKSINKAEQDCLNEWQRFVQERTGGTKSIVQSIKSFVSEEEEYQKMRQAENRIATSKPCSTEALSAIDSYLLHFNKLVEAIRLDEEILSFLKEMTDKGSVPLSRLSCTCLEKLQKQSFTNKIKIIIG